MKRLVIAMVSCALAAGPGCGKKDKDKNQKTRKPVVSEPTPPKPPTEEQPKAPPPPSQDDLIKRGQVVANAGGCVLCHTGFGPQGPDVANPFAGGLEVTEEMGPGMKFTWRAPNITPDDETGIGKWTDEQILAAIREGVRPDGARLTPIMPYMFFNVMSDADGKALVAFLRSQKKISRKVDRLPLPEMFAKMPPPPKPEGVEWPAEKHGEYMATIMHCALCHTPMGPQGPDMTRMFAGGNPMKMPPQFKAMGTGVNFSANITSDAETGIGKWTEQQVVDAIKMMKRPDAKRPQIGFPMLMYQTTWSQLPDDDVLAVAKFIKSVPAMANQVPGSTFKPGPMLEQMMKAGQAGPPASEPPGSAPPPPSGGPPPK
jgi:mono/diheme cytochrome c family protein